MPAHMSPVMNYLPVQARTRLSGRGFSLAEFLLAIAVFAIAAAGIHSLLEASLLAQGRLNRASQAKAIASEVIGRHLQAARLLLDNTESGSEPTVLGQGWWGLEGELGDAAGAVFAWRVVAAVHPVLGPGAGMVPGVRVQAEVWPLSDAQEAKPPPDSTSIPGLRRVVTHLTAAPSAVASAGFVSDVQRRDDLRRAREEAFQLQTLEEEAAVMPAPVELEVPADTTLPDSAPVEEPQQ